MIMSQKNNKSPGTYGIMNKCITSFHIKVLQRLLETATLSE